MIPVLSAVTAPGRLAGRMVSGTASDWAYAAGWMAVRAMPEFAARTAFGTGARYAARRGGPEQLRKNLARVIGVPPAEVPDSLMRASLASYARYWREAFRLPSMDLRMLAAKLDESVVGQDNLDAALTAGRGAVWALPHSGNWDMDGVWLAQSHGTFTTVAERLKPESLYRRFIAYRERLGFEVLPLSGGERPPFEVLCERLRENRVVCLMAERDLTRTGVDVEFFGETTRMPAGPAKLAIETGAPCCRRTVGSRANGWVLRHPTASGLPQRRRRRHHPGAGGPVRQEHRRPPRGLAHAATAVAGRPVRGQAGAAQGDLMRIGMVCPYSFDVPGGVQSHVLQLAEVMRQRGHEVSVLAPASPHAVLPDYVVSAGKAVPIPYNGSVARLRFGPATHRKVKKWLAEGDFDVLHLHEPNAPSLSMLALNIAAGPIVATFHTSTTKSLTLTVFQSILRPMHEKIVGRIAVSDLARRWQMEALGTDAVEIPNGVDVDSFASAPRLDGYPRPGKTVLFVGRYDEPRKGMSVLLDALPGVVQRFGDVQLLIVGRGDEDELRSQAGELVKHMRFLGQVDDAGKASAMRSADVYCAPHIGGESFGIVLVEAMAAGTAVVASDLDAFRRVLRDGEVGCLVPVGDGVALADALVSVLENDVLRERYVAAGSAAVKRYDWSVVASQIMRVYETVAAAGVKVQVAS